MLLALFLAAPPLVAFGVYFGAWHALRHTRRLVDFLAPGGERRAQALAFVRAAALPTLGALGVLAALWTMRSHAGIVATGVSLLLALTFPHVVVVAALDRRWAGRPCPGAAARVPAGDHGAQERRSPAPSGADGIPVRHAV